MIYTQRKLCLIVLLSTQYIPNMLATTAKIIPRSQSFNAARTMVGWNNPYWGINRKPNDEFYASFNLTFAYNQTFRGSQLTNCFFGSDLITPNQNTSCKTSCKKSCEQSCNAIRISGTGSGDTYTVFTPAIPPYSDEPSPFGGFFTSDRCPTDWLADYFGLPLDYDSTVSFNPRISNFLLDFSLYLGLDQWVNGMYFRIHGPFVQTRWNMGAQEVGGSYGQFLAFFGLAYVPGQFSATGLLSNEPLNQSFLEFTNGGTPTLEGITWQPLCCSRIINECECGTLTRNGFADLRFVLGWNFLNNDEGKYHLGAGIYVAAPTGSRIGDSPYLFEPIVGNGKYWELGAQITAHHLWWRSENEHNSIGVYLESNITHMFKAKQTRCFDLCSAGDNSRYMLAYRLQSNLNSNPRLDTSADTPNLEFAAEYAPVANITRRDIHSSFAVQGDLALSLAFQSGGFQWDVGYNFWGRSCEKISVDSDCCAPQGLWALKGSVSVYGFDAYSTPIGLAATDSNATINAASLNTDQRNLTCNDSVLATFDGGEIVARIPANVTTIYYPNGLPPILYSLIDPNSFSDQFGYFAGVNTSQNPVLIQANDLNLTGTRGISNKFFTHINYAWADCENQTWTPYVGIGAEVEFAKGDFPCCPKKDSTPCSNPPIACLPVGCPIQLQPTPQPLPHTRSTCCSDCAISQWGVWFKIGTSYN